MAEKERLEAEEAERLDREAAECAERERLEAEAAEKARIEAEEVVERERLEAEEAERKTREANRWLIIGLTLIACSIIFDAFHHIPEGSIGVYLIGGNLLSSIADSGWNLKFPIVT